MSGSNGQSLNLPRPDSDDRISRATPAIGRRCLSMLEWVVIGLRFEVWLALGQKVAGSDNNSLLESAQPSAFLEPAFLR